MFHFTGSLLASIFSFYVVHDSRMVLHVCIWIKWHIHRHTYTHSVVGHWKESSRQEEEEEEEEENSKREKRENTRVRDFEHEPPTDLCVVRTKLREKASEWRNARADDLLRSLVECTRARGGSHAKHIERLHGRVREREHVCVVHVCVHTNVSVCLVVDKQGWTGNRETHNSPTLLLLLLLENGENG